METLSCDIELLYRWVGKWRVDTQNHPAAFLSATRMRSLSFASSPSSACARATACAATPGLKPRFYRAETASALAPPAGDTATPMPATPQIGRASCRARVCQYV